METITSTLRTLLAFCLALVVTLPLVAQHEHHQPQPDTTKKPAQHDHHQPQADTAKAPSHADHAGAGVPMSHAFSLNLPMNRNGSGTSWLPDISPMYGYMWHAKKWMFMGHGNIVLRYNSQDISSKGIRGDTKVDAPNWFMLMGQRRVGDKGLFHFNTMLSFDALFGGDGYPLLFQTGEMYNGESLIDRQHPHDLFSELSISYTQSFTPDIDVFAYFAYPGEPALGPTAFMHRPSTANNPDAPLGHHWQDATHIVFGVATLGFRYKILKLDGSVFTGREPDDKRYNFDKPRFDSYAGRLTITPLPSLSLQVSRAYIVSPEALHPDENVNRTTASGTHIYMLPGENRFLSSTTVWGYNASEDHEEHSFLLESNLQLDRLAIYGRYEFVQKSAEELGFNHLDAEAPWNINAITLGANYTVLRQWKTNFSLGAQATVSMAPPDLDFSYGNNPLSAEIYLRVSPVRMVVGRAGRI
jgi:hypothetical protein